MAKKKKLIVQGLTIHIDKVNEKDYISLTDIAKQVKDAKPAYTIQNWLKNGNTLRYLITWERAHNPNARVVQMDDLLIQSTDNRVIISPQSLIEQINAIGLIQKSGRNAGTYAHQEIALDFCYWLSPEFKVYFNKEFVRLKEEEANRKGLEWTVKKITDNIDEVRNLLDTLPGQDPARNRLLFLEEEE